MRRSSISIAVVVGGLIVAAGVMPACGGSNSGNTFNNSSSGSGGGNGGGTSSGSLLNLDGGFSSGGNPGSSSGGSTATCPSAWQCNVSCGSGGTTSITGTVYDPSGSDPLYNIVAYVPTTPVGALPSGVPTGSSACSCSALFQGNPLVFATTDVNGKFTVTNAPVGTNIPLVIQVGKWRKQLTVNTTSCGSVDAGKITLPKNGTEGDIPDIAVSTGGADSLECLLARIGLDSSEYVPGWTQPGHIHIYNGGGGIAGLGGGGEETNPMAGAPESSGAGGLWDTSADLMKNDIVLLSCEWEETVGAIPANLETYLNAGGRAFASHFHYAWFHGSKTGGYAAPADWGNNLATWTTGSNSSGDDTTPVGGTIDTTLNAGGGSFAKGLALQQWLTVVNALGAGVPAGEVPILAPRYNANVGAANKPSQPWIDLDPATDPNGSAGDATTLYFSFDTPVSTAANPSYCGRAVFSGLHVGGASYDGVNCSAGGKGGGGGGGNAGGCNTGHVAAAPPPAGCDTTHPLSPQEKVLEFMLFDLSSCVIPDTQPPTNDAGSPVIPK
jgi:hypothetical protein